MALSDHFPEMKGWTPVEPAVNPAAVQIPTPETQVSPYLRTTLPLPLQYSGDTVKQYNRPGISSYRIAPLPPGGIPAVNAAATSVVNSSTTNIISGSVAGPNSAVQFNNAGAPGGVSQFEWLNALSTLQITGSLTVSNPIGILSGGTGTSTPALVAGMDIAITGTWPNNTVAVATQAGVVAGPYTNANITVDSSGIITAIANGTSGPVITPVNLLTQTANVAASNLVASASAGTYLVTVYLIVSQAGTVSSTLPDSRIIYTDNQSGATITVPVTSGLTTNTLSTFGQATFIVNAKSATAIQYDIGQVTPYATSGATPMQFAAHYRAVFLG